METTRDQSIVEFLVDIADNLPWQTQFGGSPSHNAGVSSREKAINGANGRG
jgi:hypothetical protein